MTGMSGAGKSTALAELARRGFDVVDTDEPGWTEWSDEAGGYIWREDCIEELLARDRRATSTRPAPFPTKDGSTGTSTRSFCSARQPRFCFDGSAAERLTPTARAPTSAGTS